MKKVLILLFCSLCTLSTIAKKDIPLKYDIVCAGSGSQGTYLVEVSVYVEKPNTNIDLIKKAAVHGVIFRGFTGAQGCTSQRPIIRETTAAQQHGDYFQAFFQPNGQFISYATLIDGSTQTTKIDKKAYRMTAVVSVAKDQLRKALEDAGIIKNLSNGF